MSAIRMLINIHTINIHWLVLGWVTTQEYHPLLWYDHKNVDIRSVNKMYIIAHRVDSVNWIKFHNNNNKLMKSVNLVTPTHIFRHRWTSLQQIDWVTVEHHHSKSTELLFNSTTANRLSYSRTSQQTYKRFEPLYKYINTNQHHISVQQLNLLSPWQIYSIHMNVTILGK